MECHGRVHEMDVVQHSKSLSMGFCLECHRNPEEYIRPPEEVYNLNWERPDTEEFKKIEAKLTNCPWDPANWNLLPYDNSCYDASREVVLFKPSKEFKEFINNKNQVFLDYFNRYSIIFPLFSKLILQPFETAFL